MNSSSQRITFPAMRVVMGLLLAQLTGLVAGPTSASLVPPQLIPAGDARFHCEGRMDHSDKSGPVVIWAGSRISLDFEGTQLALRFAEGWGQNYFNVRVDGTNTIVGLAPGEAQRIEIPMTTGPGRHHLVLFKRSEAAKGHVRFLGVELAPGARAWAPDPPIDRLKIEFFGDSITVGACNEDGAADQWEDFRTHNHALSYDYLTSQALHADHRAMAVSGMGIAAGWVDVLSGQVWDRIYPQTDSPRADLKAWQPDVAFVNLGENDSSFTHAHTQPFPSGYTRGYVALVKAIRAAYPQAQLVLLRGGMYGGAQDPAFRAGWEAAVKELEAGDARISHFVFTHWTSNHPRVADDQAMADELTAWLKQQAFMAPFL
jgi:lysophospholipase L1-like esterase